MNQPAGLDQQKLIESIDEGLSFDIAPYVEPGGHVSGAVGRGWWVVQGSGKKKMPRVTQVEFSLRFVLGPELCDPKMVR